LSIIALAHVRRDHHVLSAGPTQNAILSKRTEGTRSDKSCGWHIQGKEGAEKCSLSHAAINSPATVLWHFRFVWMFAFFVVKMRRRWCGQNATPLLYSLAALE